MAAPEQARKFAILVGKTLIGTVFCGGMFHLTLITLKAITSGNQGYVNPIDFLGLGYAFPRLNNSITATVWAWVFLIVLFFVIMYSIVHYRRYLGIVRLSNSYQKLTKSLSATTKRAGTAKSSRASKDT